MDYEIDYEIDMVINFFSAIDPGAVSFWSAIDSGSLSQCVECTDTTAA